MSLLDRLERQKTVKQQRDYKDIQKPLLAKEDEYTLLKDSIHKEIIEQMNQEALENGGLIKNQEEYISENLPLIVESKASSLSRNERAMLLKEIQDNILGLGPLEPLLADDTITEIMVNGPSKVFVERGGLLELTNVKFKDNHQVLHVINRIVASVGRHIDEATPMVDARLADGSRFNAIIPPSALNGPTVTIRKFSRTPYTVSDLIKFKTASSRMMSFLDACVKGRLNIIVSGGTGSGKTTLLNVLSGYIPNSERIITIEDAAELKLNQDHVITLESRPPNLEGAGEITIRDLVRNSLRMRPDRIIVGEVRSEETLDMLQAMNTGHEGSLTTAHANSPRELMSRLETMVLMSGMELPIKAIREQVTSAIDLVVHQARMKDGSRKIINISEVMGMEGDTVVLQDIYHFHPDGVDPSGRITGRFLSTGVRPAFLEKLAAAGIPVREEWFMN